MQALVVLGVLACSLLGLVSSCSYVMPVFVCTNIGNNLNEFLDVYNKVGRRATVIYVIGGNIGTFNVNTARVHFDHANITLSQLGITDFPRPTIFFHSMLNLVHLDLSRNKLRIIPRMPTTLKVLDLSRNRLFVPADQIKAYFASIHAPRSNRENGLREVRLSHNNLEYFTYKETTVYRLNALDLSNNPLRQLDVHVPLVENVNLSRTLFDSYDLDVTKYFSYDTRNPGVYDHKHRIIDLSNGNFKTLDPTFLERMIAITAARNVTFNLKGNPWACSCMMKKARNILLAAADKVKAAWFDDVRCATPKKLAGRRLVDVAMSDLECDERNTFWDCCYRVSLDKWETASAGCRVRGNPPPKVICKAGKSGVQIAAKNQANREDNLLLTFTALEDRYVGDVGYVCEAYGSDQEDQPKETINCPYLKYNERVQEYVAGANSLHSPSTIFIPLILLLSLVF